MFFVYRAYKFALAILFAGFWLFDVIDVGRWTMNSNNWVTATVSRFLFLPLHPRYRDVPDKKGSPTPIIPSSIQNDLRFLFCLVLHGIVGVGILGAIQRQLCKPTGLARIATGSLGRPGGNLLRRPYSHHGTNGPGPRRRSGLFYVHINDDFYDLCGIPSYSSNFPGLTAPAVGGGAIIAGHRVQANDLRAHVLAGHLFRPVGDDTCVFEYLYTGASCPCIRRARITRPWPRCVSK